MASSHSAARPDSPVLTALRVTVLAAIEGTVIAVALWLVVTVLRHYWWPVVPQIPFGAAYLVGVILVLVHIVVRLINDHAEGFIE